MIDITPAIVIDESEIQESFMRASGPGGQNVNKVETAVQLRFDAANSPALSAVLLRRLKTLAGHRMNSHGVIVICARRFRSQERNRADARDRLVTLIRQAATLPKPRRATKPTFGAKKRRLESKRQRSETKRRRGTVRDCDE